MFSNREYYWVYDFCHVSEPYTFSFDSITKEYPANTILYHLIWQKKHDFMTTYGIYQYSASDWKSSLKNEWEYCDYNLSNLYITHNSYCPKINCIYFVIKCLKVYGLLVIDFKNNKKNLFLYKNGCLWIEKYFPKLSKIYSDRSELDLSDETIGNHQHF